MALKLPFLVAGESDTAAGHTPPLSVEVQLGRTAPLTLRFLDQQSQTPIDGLAIRLWGSSGVPIVPCHGTANYFEWTSERGEVQYNYLQPGEYRVEVLGKRATVNHFLEYEPMHVLQSVYVNADEPNELEVPVPSRSLTAAEIDQRFPFYVDGRVLTDQGEPLKDVEVRAATGNGTLRRGGSTRTDVEGRYRLYFGPGMLVMDSDYAPRGVGIQAALISAHKDGWYETQLNQQGNLLMSDQEPLKIAELFEDMGEVWERESIDQIVFPGLPREIDFTLARAASIAGPLVSNGARGIEDQQIYLSGHKLPPGSRILRSATTDDDGRFRRVTVVNFSRHGLELISACRTFPARAINRESLVYNESPAVQLVVSLS